MMRINQPDGDPLPDPPSEPNDPIVVALEFTNPPTEVKGQWNGVTIVVSGTAELTSGAGAIERVEVKFGSAAFVSATMAKAGWLAWTASGFANYSGSIPVTARAFVNGQVLKERTISVATLLDPKPAGPIPPPPPDTTPPQLVISSPPPSSTCLLVGGTASLAITGTATDIGQGLRRIEVDIDGRPLDVHQVGGNWANWAAEGTVQSAGPHTVTVKAIDNAGLHSEQTVVITAREEAATTPPAIERLFIVEKCRLSSFLGAYGPGKTIKTLSLLPGEKTTINVKSYRRMTDTATEASSILDSTTEESHSDFENTLSLEQSNKHAVDEQSKWNVEGHAEATWGWGKASINAGASVATNASREELAKNVVSALQKHGAKASSKRDIEIKTSREMKREEGEEYATESKIENINVGRTLNFVFRQMNQEYITLLHLVDVRIGYVRGDLVTNDGKSSVQYTYREATLSQLDGLLRMVIVPERRDEVRKAILEILSHVFDYQDEPHRLVEERRLTDANGQPLPNGSYLRVPKLRSTYIDAVTQTEIGVPGVILAATSNVMRTDGVVCDGFLGAGETLDGYSKGLQAEAVEARKLENERQRITVERDRVGLKLIQEGNAAGAKVFRDVFPPPENESLALVTSGARDNGA